MEFKISPGFSVTIGMVSHPWLRHARVVPQKPFVTRSTDCILTSQGARNVEKIGNTKNDSLETAFEQQIPVLKGPT